MKYLCLIRAEKGMENMPPSFAAQHMDAYREFTASIRASGHYVACNRLLPAESATTIRVRQGRVSVTDGPYVETKEQLGGYFVIDARDLNEAIQIAAKIPGAALGCVELRPIAEDEPTVRALGLERATQ